jgi:hypothetical protein
MNRSSRGYIWPLLLTALALIVIGGVYCVTRQNSLPQMLQNYPDTSTVGQNPTQTTNTLTPTSSSTTGPQTTATSPIYQSGTMLYLDTGVAKIGVDLAWGGAITDLEKGSASYVNRKDAGRLVQFALWDGSDSYDNCGGCSGSFGWNPSKRVIRTTTESRYCSGVSRTTRFIPKQNRSSGIPTTREAVLMSQSLVLT